MLMRTVGTFMAISFAIIVGDVCGVVASKLGRDKGYSAIGMYFLGLLLSIVGLIIAAVMPYKPQVASGEVDVNHSQNQAVTIIAIIIGIIALLPIAYVLLTPVSQLPRM